MTTENFGSAMNQGHAWANVKAALASRSEEFVRWLFPSAVKCSVHEMAVADLSGAPGDSLKIVVSGAKVGVWRDFSGAAGGNNLLDLYIKAREVDAGEGLRACAAWAGIALPERATRSKEKVNLDFVCAYDYLDADRRLVHQTVRFAVLDDDRRPLIDLKTGGPAKQFRQRRPARQGQMEGKACAKLDRRTGQWWLWTLAGIEPVLYHLPDLIERPGEEVWLCEGEKDADALAAAGLLATTPPMGAGKWRPSYTKALSGRCIILCGDSDRAGIDGMLTIGRALDRVAASVRIVEWPEVLAKAGLAQRSAEKWDAAKFLAV